MQKPAFVTKVGLELTWVPNLDCSISKNERIADHLCESYSGIVSYLEGAKLGNWGRDPGCIELSTRILRSYDEVKRVYDEASKVMANARVGKVRWKPRNPTVVGCGGHIHADRPAERSAQKNMVRDWVRRPFLGWAFADPQDVINCGPMIGSSDWRYGEWLQSQEPHAYVDRFGRHHSYVGNTSLPHMKDLAIRFTIRTVEFRCMDRARNWSEQEAHVMFVQAYMKWITKYQGEIPLPPVAFQGYDARRKWLKTWTYKRAAEEFKAVILELGLPWERYRPFLRNLRGRFASDADKKALTN